jgi:hypothetical protein
MASMAPPPPPPRDLSGRLATAPAAAAPAHVPATAKKRSKLPLILGILAILFMLGIGVLGAAYWFVVRPMLENRKAIVVDRNEPSPEERPRRPNPLRQKPKP